MRLAKIVQLRSGNGEVHGGNRRRFSGKFAAKADGADARAVLEAHAARIECLIFDGKREGPLFAAFAHSEGVFADQRFGLKAYVLHHRGGVHRRARRSDFTGTGTLSCCGARLPASQAATSPTRIHGGTALLTSLGDG